MKQSTALSLALALSLAAPAMTHAQTDTMKGMDMKDMHKGMDMKGMDMGTKPAAGTQAAHKATGVVKKVDPKAGTVTLAHDPVKSLKWPAMTMGFTVKDKSLLDKLAAGKKVEVEFVQQGSDYVITHVK